MEMLDNIRMSLDNNPNLSSDIKDNIFELVIIFNKNFPNVKLDQLNEKLKTLIIEKSNKFLNRDISLYDYRHNILYFNEKELQDGYDAKHVLMYELLNIISSNHYQQGFNANNMFEALNVGYTEVLANYLVGNSGEKQLYPTEATEANLVSIVIGSDALFEAYFNNDAKTLIEKLNTAGVEV